MLLQGDDDRATRGTLPAAPARDDGIEAMRGIAAFVVVNWHLTTAFLPGHAGIFPGTDPRRMFMGHVWFVLANGPAAVAFFFVISGFVLTRRALRNDDSLALARGAAKRWIRLAGPVVVTLLLSWALFALGAYQFREVGPLSGSPWLTNFGYGLGGQPFRPDLFRALTQGLWWVFVRGDATYDSSLWTMRPELIGSFVAFAVALCLIHLRAAHVAVRAALVLAVAVLCVSADARVIGFPVGVGLAAWLIRPARRIGLPLAWLMAVVTVFLCGYYSPVGSYAWVTWLPRAAREPMYLHTLAAAIAIIMVEGSPPVRRFLSRRLFVAMGKLSFPVYLLHLLVICSLGSWTWLAVQDSVPLYATRAIAIVVSLVGSIAVSAPLVWFDAWWSAWVGLVASRLIPRPG